VKSNTKNRLYIKQLNLQNFATFTNESINFEDNFNAIIGETGSGKSLILEAICLILGQRADKKIIRKNSKFASVEAIFSVGKNFDDEFFNSIGHPYEGEEIVVKRIIYPSGSSKSFLNFQSCSLQTLCKFSKHFIDLVGQFENQKLLGHDYQIMLLDSYSKIEDKVKNYQNIYSDYQSDLNELETLKSKKGIESQREDYLNFQINEIKSLNPCIEREKELIINKEDLLKAQKMQDKIKEVLFYLEESENNVLSSLKKCTSLINDKVSQTKVEESILLLEEVSFQTSKYVISENDNKKLNSIIEELDHYQKLKRKFGGSTQELLNHYEQFTSELNTLKNLDAEISKLQENILVLKTQAIILANKIHEIRVKMSKTLSKELTKTVRSLKMIGASIQFKVEKLDQLSPWGLSNINFLAETNPGEGFGKIKDIASGGELSRILLAIRHILSSNDSISVFLFDEIDTGIGGETALKIGELLGKVAKTSQVIAITHLPQMANFANRLIHVSKEHLNENKNLRTQSTIHEISSKTPLKEKKKWVEAMNPLQ
jgi:DNA repair protein RecN (Recombination protein N)